MPLFLRYDDALPGCGFWVVEDKDSHEFLGWCCMRLEQNSLTDASIGYRFLPRAWGKGFATEATNALMDIGFSTLGLVNILASAYEKNLASISVMKKLGLTFVKTFRFEVLSQDTSMQDSEAVWDGVDVEYVIHRSVWLERKMMAGNVS